MKLDKNEKFVKALGDFATQAKMEFEAISKAKEKADEECTKMLKWFGEDAKVQPEEMFSALHNFRYASDMQPRSPQPPLAATAQPATLSLPTSRSPLILPLASRAA